MSDSKKIGPNEIDFLERKHRAQRLKELRKETKPKHPTEIDENFLKIGVVAKDPEILHILGKDGRPICEDGVPLVGIETPKPQKIPLFMEIDGTVGLADLSSFNFEVSHEPAVTLTELRETINSPIWAPFTNNGVHGAYGQLFLGWIQLVRGRRLRNPAEEHDGEIRYDRYKRVLQEQNLPLPLFHKNLHRLFKLYVFNGLGQPEFKGYRMFSCVETPMQRHYNQTMKEIFAALSSK